MQNSVLRDKIACLYAYQSSPVIFCMQISDFSTWNTSLYWSQPSCVVFACKTATFGPVYKSHWVPDITCRFVHAKQRDEHLNYLSLCVPTLICCFCMQNSVLRAKIACLYGSQSSPMIFCMKNSVPSIRITSLHGSQVLCVVYGCKTATFGPEKQISMSPRHNLSFCACKTAWFAPELLVSMGSSLHLWFCAFKTATFGAILQVSIESRPHLSFCACKTAWLASELLVSRGPSPHLWFLNAKQRLLGQNNNSLWIPELTCGFVRTKQRD